MAIKATEALKRRARSKSAARGALAKAATDGGAGLFRLALHECKIDLEHRPGGQPPRMEARDTSRFVRKLLELRWPRTKFSVRLDRGRDLDVRWLDGPTVQQVDALIGGIQGKQFDGMQDLETYRQTYLQGFGRVDFSVGYISTHRDYGVSFLTAVALDVARRFGIPHGPDDPPLVVVNEHTGAARVDDAGAGNGFRAELGNEDLRTYVWRLCRDIASPGTGEAPVLAGAAKPEPVARPLPAAASAAQAPATVGTVEAEAPPGATVEVVAHAKAEWVWLTFGAKPAPIVLEKVREIGGRWAQKRQAWYVRDAAAAGLTPACALAKIGAVPLALALGDGDGGGVVGVAGAAGPAGDPPGPAAGGGGGNPDKARQWRARGEGLQKAIDRATAPRLANTNRRARFAESALKEGERLLQIQRACFALADAWEAGTVPALLTGLASRTDVEILLTRSHYPEGAYAGDDGPKLARAGVHRHTWNEAHRALAGLTPDDPSAKAAAAARAARLQEAELARRGIPGYFPTPPEIADMVAEKAWIGPGMYVLEPSAGAGALAEAVYRRFQDGPGGYEKNGRIQVWCIERNESLREVLKAKGLPLLDHRDFLTYGTDEADPEGLTRSLGGAITRDEDRPERIVMNPPFEHGQDIDHVQHAFKLLRPGGRLVAIMSAGTFHRSDRKAQGFREFLATAVPYGLATSAGHVPLPEGAFKTSDRPTGVNCVLVTIDKAA